VFIQRNKPAHSYFQGTNLHTQKISMTRKKNKASLLAADAATADASRARVRSNHKQEGGQNGWGTTVFKLFAIILRCRPCQSFIVCLGAPHGVAIGGLTLVTWLGEVVIPTCVTLGDLVSMGTAITISVGREKSAPGAFLLEHFPDGLELS
jgi:hypothetical protein